MEFTTVDLIRHGEPEGGSRYRGHIDDPLSKRGWEQMRSVVEEFAPWNRVLTSPLSRCREFAVELAEREQIPMEEIRDFMEIGFGAWEGKSAKELMDDDPESLRRFWSDPINNTPPDAETIGDFSQRITVRWEQIINDFRGEHMLVVGHAGVIRMIISHVLGMPMERMFRIDVPNAGISRIQIDHFGEESLPRLIFHAGILEQHGASEKA
ncbi:MAG: alpha-ribazole phosphatase [Gammaproteobacteria bacterium]|uniref:Alpha-ribazole phosphatase n=1 Tax=Candidatus Thiopontia autotrophica TaxID=2841688 RepID=A0A8J6PB19_9GAMM|nr:alpha-ribazole phosphatase [Candidatus Thiopontia autotrophica]MBL6969229.1 alpha-ribazole phosphatase [Gammaproteobacteria bacterium]